METSEVELNAFCSMVLLQAYGGLGMECGHLNGISLHNLIGNAITRMSGFVGVNMALLKEVCHCRG